MTTTTLARRAPADTAQSAAQAGGTWYVIRTQPKKVKDLRAEAARLRTERAPQGVEVFVPEYAYEHRNNKRRGRPLEIVYCPVFPGYAFVPRGQHAELRQLPLNLRDRYQFLRSGFDRWAEIWPGQIEDMKAQTEAWCRIGPEPMPRDLFEVGQKVRIQGDLFPPARVIWVGDRRIKVDSELGPIEVDAALLTAVEG